MDDRNLTRVGIFVGWISGIFASLLIILLFYLAYLAFIVPGISLNIALTLLFVIIIFIIIFLMTVAYRLTAAKKDNGKNDSSFLLPPIVYFFLKYLFLILAFSFFGLGLINCFSVKFEWKFILLCIFNTGGTIWLSCLCHLAIKRDKC
jgi:hypothetical protein